MKLHDLDRRWIFLLILLGVAIPLFIPIGFHMEVSKNVQTVYDLVNSTPEGSRILISLDCDPSTKAELQPAVDAMIQHAVEKNLKIVCMALWPMGAALTEESFQTNKDVLVYGENFINLGYKAGGLVTIQAIAKNFREIFPKDNNGTNVDEYTILDGIEKLTDFAFVASISSGVPGMKEWIMVAGDSYGLPVTGATTAVSAPGFMPYINEKQQLTGLIGGLKAAAEYEMLIGQPAVATSGMDAQSISHIIIIIFIIIGNVSYHLSRKKQGGS